ncbi:LEAF RUST 10 DISEASE-RESISTANCE LOCUS RECEPTOR-LIKE PROTEIN KINASE-like 1.1 [Eucalyptus grandis]|uniref:LEAF RUST 10 DISEASE-RESISTANCE LOCUS RECEPTOR-LIKE PROTEIN KINASE-like 1.1 n=1 Tax=Eucalyptus grandis TaxID=71139 RepID=UPI00192ECCEE|nr:LEAF RUST 10 DISEASE-RESISTANCE LOCUS RECEPTOR-LIKE PROTEIN KINASE-like 1.1 [Eucalyptus grandis]
MIRHKQQHCFLKFHSRHASSDSSLKADLEVGKLYLGVSIFTNAELEEATNHFDSARELGAGGFGIVYYGKLRDGREVAVKRLYERNYRWVKQFMTEVQILTRLRHKNLVSLYGCTSRHSHELLLVYEYIPNGTVADHLHGERAKQVSLLWTTRISIAIETATALAYLHASDTIHRDVKTDNILLDNNFSVKVADFGLSRLFPNDVSHVSTAPQGTPGYVDPEYHQCYQLTEKSDVYSFGVVLVELISSMPAVDTSRDRHEINLADLATSKIWNQEFCELIDPNLGFESDPEINRMIMAVAELAFRCLQQDKDVRPSMETVLEELKVISSGTHEPGKSKDVSYDNSAGQSENPPPSPECDNVELLKNVKSLTSPVSVTQKWGSSGSSSVHSG